MPGKGKLSGFYWHKEFHTVDPKREKAADCIYLSKDRICRNRECIINGEKCFVATHCRYRVKKADGTKAQPPAPSPAWVCSLPRGCYIYHKESNAVGEYVGCNSGAKTIAIKFDDGVKHFLYPQAFKEEHLYGNQEVSDCIRADEQS